MNISEFYSQFCRLFHNSKIPGIKFTDLDLRANKIYKKNFNLDSKDVNKATFSLFLLINLISISFLFITPDLDLFIYLFISFVCSLLVSYWFNTKIYRKIKREESKINVTLYLIKIYYSLIQKTLEVNSDRVFAFLSLVNEFGPPITSSFENFLRSIQEGQRPEDLIDQVITPSEDFDDYLKELLLNEFEYDYEKRELEGSAERDFKVYTRQLESRLSIVFFIGTFFPIGMCFLILFQMINTIILLSIVPCYYFLLRIIYRKFVKKDLFLLGLIKDYSRSEKKKFLEFLTLLERFALNLRRGISPEIAFIDTFKQIKNQLKLLYDIINHQTNNLTNKIISFSDMIKIMKSEINSVRYSIILDIVEKLVIKNSMDAAFKIKKILDFLNHHQELEKKLETIFKGEKFKAFLFLFILPFILGIIGGIFPSFFILLNNIDVQSNLIHFFFLNLDLIYGIVLIFIFLLLCLVISSNYFLKIINYERRLISILIGMILYIFLFIMSFINVSNFI